MKLTFMGAIGTVTGSKYLLQESGKKYLIDCGMFQGLKELRLRNWDKFPVNPASIDAVILTHAHIDHSGYLPLLVKNGFKGKIYCSEATFDLCKILLPDSAYLHEEDAERANKYGYTKHKPALPLYTQVDARKALELFEPIDFGKTYALDNVLSFSLSRAGHILGAACVRIDDGHTSIVFSGDLGRPNDPIMKPPVAIQEADYLVLESTYGDRRHEETDPLDRLEEIINNTASRGGSVIIPSFAVGRAQSLMFYIHELKRQKRINKNIPVFLDSPMAINVTQLLKQHFPDHKLSPEKCAEVFAGVTYTKTAEESKAIYDSNNNMPKIIISASGMATGGRILHHLKHFIGDGRNTIILAGFQAAGTRGARLAHGETEIKIHGQLFPVRADIEKIDSMSAHGDYQEIMDWLRHFTSHPRKTFLVHGEPEAVSSFKFKIEEHLGWNVEIPEYLKEVEL